MADLSQHKTLIALRSGRRLPSWLASSARMFLITMVGTLLSFAFSLLFAILGLLAVSRFEGTHPNMAIAYRTIALPIGLLGGVITSVFSLITEVRQHRQAKALKHIERIS